MEEQFVAYFSRIQPLSAEEKEAITRNLDIQTFKKGALLLRAGQKAVDNYFVLKGCVRQYYLQEGEEKTTHFFTEEEWILPAIDVDSQEGSTYYLACTEESVVVVGNDQQGEELIRQFPKFQEISRRLLEKEILKHQAQLSRYHRSTPEQRYLHLIGEKAGLLDRIPQYQLSSYIGVTPESLSRIKKRIADRENSRS